MYVEMKREMGQGLAGSLEYKTLGSDHADIPPWAILGLTVSFVIVIFLFKQSKGVRAIWLYHAPFYTD